MSVILEFTIDGSQFQLGQVLSGPPAMHLEIERIVPTGDAVMPFLWATGEDFEQFESKVRAHPMVENLLVLDSLDGQALYRITWGEEPRDLIDGIARADATVLDAQGETDEWVFRLRFPDHDRLSMFHNYVIQHAIDLHIDRTYTLAEITDHGFRFGLSQEQREALLLALNRGYFETPRQSDLEDLAVELDISRQALSNRIRLGNEKILRSVLLSSASAMD